MVKKYKEGSIVLGTVTGIKDYGIFVKLDNEHSGLIHISEIGNHYIDDLNKYANLNELIRVKILEVDLVFYGIVVELIFKIYCSISSILLLLILLPTF